MPSLSEYEAFCRTRLSRNFIMRDFMFSTSSDARGVCNYPDDPELVVRAGKQMCETILEPILAEFGQFSITYGYQNRQGTEAGLTPAHKTDTRNTHAHQWDRRTFGDQVYARVDILPFRVEDGEIKKEQLGRWLMWNLDIDLLMQWTKSNVFCITISPLPRRVWLEWGRPSLREPQRRFIMGEEFWQQEYQQLAPSARPKFGPSSTGGRMQGLSAR